MRERKITGYKRLDRNIVVETDIKLKFQREVDDDIDDTFITDIITEHGEESIKKCIRAYEQSELPDVFLKGQKFILTNQLPYYIYGYLYLPNDDIVLDIDTINNIRRVESTFLFGHEMGHKIDRYRETTKTKEEIARVLQMSFEGNEYNLKELYADLCGLIVSDFNRFHESDQVKYLKRRVLSDLHRY